MSRAGARRMVVIGGSSGIGRATALHLADLGHDLLVCGTDEGRLASTAEAGPAADRIETVRLDLADRRSLEAFAGQVEPFDDLVLSAGRRGEGKAFLEASFSDMEAQIDLRLRLTLRAVHRLAPLIRKGGTITFVTGVAARKVLQGGAALGVVNAGLEAATISLAVELAPLRVNAVAPGRLDTSFWDGLSEDIRESMRRDAALRLPAGRIGRAEDAAAAIAFLIASDFITGTVIDCDGGMKLV